MDRVLAGGSWPGCNFGHRDNNERDGHLQHESLSKSWLLEDGRLESSIEPWEILILPVSKYGDCESPGKLYLINNWIYLAPLIFSWM